MAARIGEFVFVRCSDKKTAELVKPGRPPQAIIFDCDGDRIGDYSLKGADTVVSAMDQALKTWCDKEITWNTWNVEILNQAKEEKKPIVLLFADDKKDSEETAKAMEHRAIAKHHDKVILVKVPFVKDSEAAKQWGVYMAPTVLFIDSSREANTRAIIEQLTGKQRPHALRGLFLKSFEKIKAAAKG